MSVDYASDMSILFTLLQKGHHNLFIIGLIIDLLPGPITAFQMYLNGYGWKSLTLIIHPINIIMQSLLTFCSSNSDFHRQILLFCKEIQGLLESPMQIIFTSVLIAHRILPLPWEESVVYTTSFGFAINLSFLPFCSIIISLAMVIYNTSATVMLIKYDLYHIKKTLSWIIYLTSTILFRLEVWVLLWVYLVELAVIPAILLLISNFICLYYIQDNLNFDPILGAILSLIFPTAYTRSMQDLDKIQEQMEFIKKVHMILALIGNFILSKY